MRTLHGPGGEPYPFEAGNFCLELLVTGGPGPYARYEILHTPEDLTARLSDLPRRDRSRHTA